MTTPPRLVRLSTVIIVNSLLLCLLVIAVLGTMPAYGATQLMDSINSVGHLCFFGALAFLIALSASRLAGLQNRSEWYALTMGLVGATAIGAALEVIQMWIPSRSPSREDLLQDLLGAVAAVCLLYLTGWVRRREIGPPPLRWLVAILLMATLTIGLIPLTSCLLDLRSRDRAAPLLVDFRARWTTRFLKYDDTVQIRPTAPPPDWPASAGTNVAQVRIGIGERYPGWGITEPYSTWPADCDFVADVFLTQPDHLLLTLRIHDAQHNDDYYDRFDREFLLTRGYQQLRIPAEDIRRGPRSRQLDLHRIRGFKFYVVKPSSPIEFTVGNVRLESKRP